MYTANGMICQAFSTSIAFPGRPLWGMLHCALGVDKIPTFSSLGQGDGVDQFLLVVIVLSR